MKKLLIPIAVACALSVLPASAAQAYTTTDKGWTNYVGKTKEGSKISFAYRKGTISIISTMVPSTCASGQGGTPRARMTMFDPPQSVTSASTAASRRPRSTSRGPSATTRSPPARRATDSWARCGSAGRC